MTAANWAAAFEAGDPDTIGRKIYEAINAGVRETHPNLNREWDPWDEADDGEKLIYVTAGQVLQDQGLLRVAGTDKK